MPLTAWVPTAAVDQVWESGVVPANLVGNGMDVIAAAGFKLARYTNMLAGRRKRVLYQKCVGVGEVAGGLVIQNHGAFRTTPNSTNIRCAIVCEPCDSTSSALIPSVNVNLNTDGSTTTYGISQPLMYIGRRKTTASVPSDLFLLEQLWDGRAGTTRLSPDQTYYFRVNKLDNARVLSMIIFEEQNDQLFLTPSSPSGDHAVDPSRYLTRTQITDVTLDDIQDTLSKIHRRQGGRILSWCKPDAGSPASTASGTFVNMLDASFTDWNAAAPGFWCWPYKKGTRSSTNVPFTVIARTGGSGEVVLRTAAGVNLVTLSGSGHQVGTGNLDSSQASSKIDVLFRATSGTYTLESIAVWEHGA